jgi:hypothetical protein
MMMEAERLFEEAQQYKSQYNAEHQQNVQLRTRLAQLEDEIEKRDGLIGELQAVHGGESNYEQNLQKSHLVSGLKQIIRDLRRDVAHRDSDIQQLRKDIKSTLISELQAENESYLGECIRLRGFLERAGIIEGRTVPGEEIGQMSALTKANSDLKTELEGARRELDKWKDKALELERRPVLKGKNVLERELMKLRRQISESDIKSKSQTHEEISLLQTSLSKCQDALEHSKRESKALETQLVKSQGEVTELLSQMSKLQAVKAEGITKTKFGASLGRQLKYPSVRNLKLLVWLKLSQEAEEVVTRKKFMQAVEGLGFASSDSKLEKAVTEVYGDRSTVFLKELEDLLYSSDEERPPARPSKAGKVPGKRQIFSEDSSNDSFIGEDNGSSSDESQELASVGYKGKSKLESSQSDSKVLEASLPSDMGPRSSSKMLLTQLENTAEAQIASMDKRVIDKYLASRDCSSNESRSSSDIEYKPSMGKTHLSSEDEPLSETFTEREGGTLHFPSAGLTQAPLGEEEGRFSRHAIKSASKRSSSSSSDLNESVSKGPSLVLERAPSRHSSKSSSRDLKESVHSQEPSIASGRSEGRPLLLQRVPSRHSKSSSDRSADLQELSAKSDISRRSISSQSLSRKIAPSQPKSPSDNRQPSEKSLDKPGLDEALSFEDKGEVHELEAKEHTSEVLHKPELKLAAKPHAPLSPQLASGDRAEDAKSPDSSRKSSSKSYEKADLELEVFQDFLADRPLEAEIEPHSAGKDSSNKSGKSSGLDFEAVTKQPQQAALPEFEYVVRLNTLTAQSPSMADEVKSSEYFVVAPSEVPNFAKHPAAFEEQIEVVEVKISGEHRDSRGEEKDSPMQEADVQQEGESSSDDESMKKSSSSEAQLEDRSSSGEEAMKSSSEEDVDVSHGEIEESKSSDLEQEGSSSSEDEDDESVMRKIKKYQDQVRVLQEEELRNALRSQTESEAPVESLEASSLAPWNAPSPGHEEASSISGSEESSKEDLYGNMEQFQEMFKAIQVEQDQESEEVEAPSEGASSPKSSSSQESSGSHEEESEDSQANSSGLSAKSDDQKGSNLQAAKIDQANDSEDEENASHSRDSSEHSKSLEEEKGEPDESQSSSEESSSQSSSSSHTPKKLATESPFSQSSSFDSDDEGFLEQGDVL